MSLRLTSGFCRGMELASPDSGTRPTAARVRSAVWNALQDTLEGARVLDLFAGSGAVGIEALSRGAHTVYFVENNRAAFRILQRNLEEVQKRAKQQSIGIEIVSLAQPAQQALKKLPSSAFDILWLDPPYAELETLLPSLLADLRRVAAEEARLVIESDRETQAKLVALIASAGEDWQLLKQKVYGKIGVSFFEPKPLTADEDTQ